MRIGGGWRQLHTPGRAQIAASPFGRLALTHAVLVAGDTLVTMALAGSLFFSISPGAAKGRVALYLALTMAPFAVVAPLLGPAIDRSRGGRKLVVLTSAGGRSLACVFMADDLTGLLLFPEAFVVLVLSKAYAVAKSALVPTTVTSDDELVGANARLQLIAVVVGVVAALPGILVLQLLDGRWVLRVAAVVFAFGTLAAFRLRPVPAPQTTDEGRQRAVLERAELRSLGIRLAASAMGLLRGIVGFLTFLVAFAFRRGGAPSWWFGIVLGASMLGTLLGNLLAPQLRRRVAEERILMGVLVGLAVVGLLAARAGGRVWTAVLATAVGAAASAGKLAFDSLVQRDAPDAVQGRVFARFETRFQLVWVVGAFIPVVFPIPSRLGFLVLALTAGFAAFSYIGGTRAAARQHRVAPA